MLTERHAIVIGPRNEVPHSLRNMHLKIWRTKPYSSYKLHKTGTYIHTAHEKPRVRPAYTLQMPLLGTFFNVRSSRAVYFLTCM